MSDYNLIDEPWISVVVDYKGTTKLVGLKEFFEHAHEYIALAGDMPTQDFAVMRFLLAILHTVFSRYDAHGEAYEMIELNDRMQQIEKVDLEDEEDYEDALMETWKDLWNAKKFPEIVVKYLDAWHDRFYLFDDKYPFYQVTEDIFKEATIYNQKSVVDDVGKISFKTINRLISESNEKVSIFSMKNSDKNKLTTAQLTRWIIHYMGYSTTSDKYKFKAFHEITDIEKYDAPAGWLYTIGGLNYKVDNLFETLLLNFIIAHPEERYRYNIQRPSWEFTPSENTEFYLNKNGSSIDNLARLYTDYGRAIKIVNQENIYDGSLESVQLPILDKKYNLLECMTIWDKQKNAFNFSKRKTYESLWRNFGMIYCKSDDYKIPGIVDWIRKVSTLIDVDNIRLVVQVLVSDQTASNKIKSEIYDELYLNLKIIGDDVESGWIFRIKNIVDNTKNFLERYYKNFISDLMKLCNNDKKIIDKRTCQYMANIYYKIDKPFNDWLHSIKLDENKDEKEKQWLGILKSIILDEINKIYNSLGNKFYIGREIKRGKKSEYINIAIIYNNLRSNINKKL